MSEFSDSMISVNRGVVSPINMDETRKRIQGYFNKVEFLKWDDIVAPKISFKRRKHDICDRTETSNTQNQGYSAGKHPRYNKLCLGCDLS
jgi:hypothetical protein